MPRTRWLPLLLVLLAVALTSCVSEPGDQGGVGKAQAPDSVAPAAAPGRIYDRVVAFMTTRSDSTLLVPWMFSARSRPGAVERQARAWLVRGGTWESFLADTWETPPSRVPWRLLPRGAMHLVVGEADALERLVFEEGPRQLELAMGSTLVEWSGRRGESFRLLDGTALLSGERVQGLVLDLSRVRRPEDPPPGDWTVLASGDSLQVVVSDPGEGGTEGAPYQAWARVDFREIQWPAVEVRWTETRAFEKARRDVPVAWSLRSSDGELQGTLSVESAQVQAGEGEGPLLPVDALFEVSGTVQIGESVYPVRGLFRHVQP